MSRNLYRRTNGNNNQQYNPGQPNPNYQQPGQSQQPPQQPQNGPYYQQPMLIIISKFLNNRLILTISTQIMAVTSNHLNRRKNLKSVFIKSGGFG